MKKLIYIFAILIIVYAVGQTFNFFPKISLENYFNLPKNTLNVPLEQRVVVYEESIITKVVEDSIPSVVTIGINKIQTTAGSIQINPLNPLSPIQQIPGKTQEVKRNIGSGFIISEDGLIITNRHVVEDEEAKYTVLTNDKKQYNVLKIYRDPLNDLAILKINATKLKPLGLGDSSTIKLGQLAIAIGTPLEEFTNTVTAGIVSGLGRGITAGSPLEGYVEKLDNVIQTDAAINPGNSGGPLLNSKGQVIGINTAIAQEGQNIGFAIPSNVIKEIVDNFKKRGNTFERPYLGIRYTTVDKETAILNKIVEGAYVISVVKGSPADGAGIQVEDIITEIDNEKVDTQKQDSVAKMILDKNVGQTINIKIYRDKKFINVQVTLKGQS
jgi:S1-C subfamily serine protease